MKVSTVQFFPIDLHRDERGYLFSPFEDYRLKGIEPFHFHVYTIEPGYIRGNHVHTGRNEYILSFGGQALLAILDPERKKVLKTYYFEKDKPTCAVIPMNTLHCLYNSSECTFVGASFSDQHCPGAGETVRSEISLFELQQILAEEESHA